MLLPNDMQAGSRTGQCLPGSFDSFAPVHKSALGVAVGLVSSLMLVALTVLDLLSAPADGPRLELLAQHFHGYTVSWTGAAVGAFWGFAIGFVGGWFAAFVRNFALAMRVVGVRQDAALGPSFFDYI